MLLIYYKLVIFCRIKFYYASYLYTINSEVNTFASQRLVFEEKKKLFLLKNASNLTGEYFMTILTRKVW